MYNRYLLMSNATIANVEWYYNNYNVYRALVVCNTDMDVASLSKSLAQLNHSIYTISALDLDDEREVYLKHLREFKNQSSYRMLIMSYEVFISIQQLVEAYVLPEQNLIVFDDISDDALQYILRWLHSAKSRGFITRNDCTVLSTIDEIVDISVI
jgi:hypothetical protein